MKQSVKAKKLWETIPHEVRVKVLNNVWCRSCGTVGIVIHEMNVKDGNLILRGKCIKCSGPVARLIETSESTR
jgi:hypothetical protein